MFTYLITAFGAGLLTSLSPCVYPMLPITLGYLTRQSTNEESRARKKIQVVAFFLGQVICFTSLGILAVRLGEIFGFSSQSRHVNLVVGVLLLALALASISSKFQVVLSKLNSFMPQFSLGGGSLFSGFLFGVSSALVASPCTSPVLGGVLGEIATQGNVLAGVLQMIAFSMGMGAIFLSIGLGLINLKSLPKSGKWMGKVKGLTTLMLVFASGYYFYLAL